MLPLWKKCRPVIKKPTDDEILSVLKLQHQHIFRHREPGEAIKIDLLFYPRNRPKLFFCFKHVDRQLKTTEKGWQILSDSSTKPDTVLGAHQLQKVFDKAAEYLLSFFLCFRRQAHDRYSKTQRHAPHSKNNIRHKFRIPLASVAYDFPSAASLTFLTAGNRCC